ncbi:hypothetical protein [Cohnella silvisoli]|uniref:DUF4367 domain-containing protein n=1 Tax=Cohnella silvisoli TaxID=2873699 RepID=A0ABV1KUL4_9BACL|nr:hypothetical protein [Cohnella silvisoli]MCD9023034.1 hypothetical protein [Cohnella silvisoli]
MNDPKPDWYGKAKDAFDKPLFTEEMKLEVSRRIQEKQPVRRNRAVWTVTAAAIVICAAILLVVVPRWINDYTPLTASPPSSSNLETQTPAPTESGKDKLFSRSVYEGTSTIQLQVNGSAVDATWFKDPLESFGLYLPASVKTVKFEDGYEYKTTDGKGIIQLRGADESTLPSLRLEKDLSAYEEYVGTEFWGDNQTIRYDYFLLEADADHRTYIAIRYNTTDTKQVRPQLLAVIANIRYVPEN